jgi:CRP/FNR family transcriptional regulator
MGTVSQTFINSKLRAAENVLQFEPGEALFREGEAPLGVFILDAGCVDLLFSARNGNVKALRVAERGQILGLSSVVGRRPHECSATARTHCRAGFVGRDVFLRLLDDYPAIWFSVLSLLSSDVNAAYDDMRALVAR